MKKLFKIIPLLVLPLALSSCSIINSFINGGNNQQQTTKTTTLELSSEALSMGFGRTAEISATLKENKKGVDATINWSTSNASVASLSKTKTTTKGEKVIVTAGNSEGSAVITAKTADGKYTKTCSVSVKDVSGTTVMIYMCGADLESGYDGYNTNTAQAGYATSDLNEILAVNGQPNDVNIVVQTGGAKAWAKSNINANKSQRWEIRNRQFNKISETTKKNMGLTSTLQDFLVWGLTNYPAEKYGLIMWNHGGAMDGCCFDEQFTDSQGNGDGLTPIELYNAATNARAAVGMASKLEWITYDACLMAVQDIAEYNSHNFNYMLASQESEGGNGYDYDAWLPTLYSNSSVNTETLLEKIGHTFMLEEERLFQGWGDPFDQTQSVLDLSKMDAYKSAFESLASDLNNIIGTNSTKIKSLGNAIKSAQKYGATEDEYENTVYPFDIFDVKSALEKISAKSDFSSASTKINAVLSALDELVVYEEHGNATSGSGLCLFCPISGYSYKYDYDNAQVKSNLTNWKVVANKINSKMSGGSFGY